MKFISPKNRLPELYEVVIVKAIGLDNNPVYCILYWDGSKFCDAVDDKFNFTKEKVIGWMNLDSLDEIEVDEAN